MRKFFWTLLIVLVSARGVIAANLGATIRLDSQNMGSTPLPILVLVKTSTAAVENQINVTAGNGWSVSNSVVVSTTGLPNGVTPLPSIMTGISTGQKISFPCNDLTSGIKYGFFITSGISNNPNTVDNTWVVATNADSMKLNVPVLANDQITINGKVGAKASDFQLEINVDKTGYLAAGDELTYTINFGSYLLGPTKPLKISANWSRGTVDGSPSPSIDVVDYVVGSGSTGYGGVVPVVDIVNRKIEWTISSFPANTINQQLSFKLKVTDTYSGSNNVNFEVQSLLSGANVVTTNTSVNSVFKPAVVALTPTSAPEPTTISTANPSTAVTPTTSPSLGLKIESVEMVNLNDSGASILVKSNLAPTELKLIYGDSIVNLAKSVISLNKLTSDTILIDGLKPGTTYFFKVVEKQADGDLIYSDIFTFKTAIKSDAPVVDKQSLLVSLNNTIVLDSSQEIESVNSVVIIPSQNFSVRIKIAGSEKIKSAKLMLRNARVLGISTVMAAEPSSQSVDLTQLSGGGFVGMLASPTVTGDYDLVLRVEDTNGNIVENIIGRVRVLEPIMVLDENGLPVENAQIFIYRQNEKTKVFEPISVGLGLQNPSFTEPNGKLNLALPKGKYKIEVSEVGFEPQTIEFAVGINDGDIFPKVILKQTKISFSNKVKYYQQIAGNVAEYSSNYLATVTESRRFFDLVAVVIGLLGAVIGWIFLAKGRNLKWWMLPWLLKHTLIIFEGKAILFKLRGQIIDEINNEPVSKAIINLIDGTNNQIIGKTTTNIIGEFEMKLEPAERYKIVVNRDGYETTNILDFTKEGLKANNLIITMKNAITNVEEAQIQLSQWVENSGNFGMMVLLIILALLEIRFVGVFGWWQAGPWLVSSVLLCIFWMIIYEK